MRPTKAAGRGGGGGGSFFFFGCFFGRRVCGVAEVRPSSSVHAMSPTAAAAAGWRGGRGRVKVHMTVRHDPPGIRA